MGLRQVGNSCTVDDKIPVANLCAARESVAIQRDACSERRIELLPAALKAALDQHLRINSCVRPREALGAAGSQGRMI